MMDPNVGIAFLAALVEASGDAIVTADLDGKITSWNAGAERLLGYTAAEALGNDVVVAYPPDRLHEKALIRDVLRRGERLENFETIRIRKEGTAVEVEVTHSPIRAACGTMIGVLSIGRDIGERRRNEEIRSRLAAIVESSDDAIVSKDLQGNILTWNAGAAWLFGYTAEEAVGQPAAMLFPPDRKQEERAILEAVRAGDKVDHQITTRLTQDGRLIDVFVSVSPIRNARGEIVGASSLIQDATGFVVARREQERWTAELECRVEARTAELQAAVEEMEAFAYSASHDLRAPLRTVELCARMLEEDKDSTFGEEAKGLLRRQRRATARMNGLITDLLNYSRLARQEVSPCELDLSNVAKRVWDEVTQGTPLPSLNVEIEPGMRAWGDPTLVRFALQNLLQNAVKFSPNGGIVRVTQESDGTFAVRDEGVGFDMQYAGRLFQPFQRLVRDSEFPGSGIGLANVRRIVERHGGRIWAESEPGRGTTFRFTLSPPAETEGV